VPESGPLGSVRGAAGNGRPYRELASHLDCRAAPRLAMALLRAIRSHAAPDHPRTAVYTITVTVTY